MARITFSLAPWHVTVLTPLSSVLQQQVDGLSQRKAELQAEGQKPLVGPEEQRAALLAQIKADNEACELAAQKAKQATESIRQLERQGITAQPARYPLVA